MSSSVRYIAALAASVIVVHLVYVGVVWPEAALLIEASRALGESAPRAVAVILKDWEQEACLILMLWGVFMIGDKCVAILRQRYLFNVDLLDGADAGPPDGADNAGSDFAGMIGTLEGLPKAVRATPLLRTLMAALRRFVITRDVHNTSETITASVEALAQKQEAENSMIRYLIWAIPAIGFIGTVRGIGEALAQADQALAGDIAGMTESLGVAFNSTFVALLISIVLMFLLHQLQRLQDGMLVDMQEYCESFLLNRIGTVGRG